MKKGILISTIVGIVFSINSLYALDVIKSEFLVSLGGANAANAMDANGNFVVVWEGYDAIGGSGVYAIRYDSLGQELTPPVGEQGTGTGNSFKVNAVTGYSQQRPNVSMDRNGNFVITWQHQTEGDPFYPFDGTAEIRARLYDNGGNSVGSEFVVNTSSLGLDPEPTIAMCDTSFAVTWSDGFSSRAVYAQRFDNGGNPLGGELLLATEAWGSSIAMEPTGNFVIAWGADDGSGNNSVRATLFDAGTNTLGDSFQVNTNTIPYGGNVTWPPEPTAAMNSDGFVITWTALEAGGGQDIRAQRFNQHGNTVGSEFRVTTTLVYNNIYSFIGMDDAGSFVVAWDRTQWGPSGPTSDVYAQTYDAGGNPIGSEFRVSSYTTAWLGGVSMGANGNFVVAWWGNGANGSGVYAQLYGDDTDPGTCIDSDTDGYGNPAHAECTHPELDCDDSNSHIYPTNSNSNCDCEEPIPQGTTELCTGGLDEDCDGLIDSEDPDCWTCTEQAECQDNDECTEDTCVDHQCQNSPVNCDDLNECTEDSCDSLSGCHNTCNSTGPGDLCCDNPACQGDPVCATGTCAGSAQASTYDLSPVHGSSDLARHLGSFLLPVAAVIGLMVYRRKR